MPAPDLGYIPLRNACALLPGRRRGKRVNVVTIWRYATRGKRGVLLRTVSLPCGLATTVAWVEQFVAATSRQRKPDTAHLPVRPIRCADSASAQSHHDAMAYLHRTGVIREELP